MWFLTRSRESRRWGRVRLKAVLGRKNTEFRDKDLGQLPSYVACGELLNHFAPQFLYL